MGGKLDTIYLAPSVRHYISNISGLIIMPSTQPTFQSARHRFHSLHHLHHVLLEGILCTYLLPCYSSVIPTNNQVLPLPLEEQAKKIVCNHSLLFSSQPKLPLTCHLLLLKAGNSLKPRSNLYKGNQDTINNLTIAQYYKYNSIPNQTPPTDCPTP